MRLPTSITLSPLDPKRKRRELTFSETEVELRQARFQNRKVLIPTLAVKNFRFKAVIDFVVVRVFVSRTQHHWLQPELRKVLPRDSWITPIDPGRGRESDEFDIRIQEPRSSAEVAKAITSVGARHGERKTPEIREIEFSLDIYSRGADDDEREQMVGLLQRTYFASLERWQNGLDMPRSTAVPSRNANTKPTTKYLQPLMGQHRIDQLPKRPTPDEFHAPFLDGTMYLGEKDTSGMIRIQNKELDQQNPAKASSKELMADQRRARVEVTLKGDNLKVIGLKDLLDLKHFNFGKLQKKFFQFMLPTFSTPDPEKSAAMKLVAGNEEERRAEVFLKSGVLALMRRDAAWEEYQALLRPDIKRVFLSNSWPLTQKRVGLGSTTNMLAYKALNRHVETAFRKLGEREQRAWNRKM